MTSPGPRRAPAAPGEGPRRPAAGAVGGDLGRLAALLGQDVGKFGRYQVLPPVALERCPALAELGYDQAGHVPFDGPRYGWLTRNLDLAGLSVVEAGANLGYFALSLAAEYGGPVRALEPVAVFSEACALIARLCGLKDQVTCINEGLALDDIEGLPETDLIVLLNVLHHAGTVFDADRIAALGGWEAYAREYLARLGRRAVWLFFQIGNTARGEALFPGREAIPFVHTLLTVAGWTVEKIGIVEDFERLSLSTVTPEAIAELPRIWCRRNPESGLVDYFEGERLLASLATGMAQRPLWLCRAEARERAP